MVVEVIRCKYCRAEMTQISSEHMGPESKTTYWCSDCGAIMARFEPVTSSADQPLWRRPRAAALGE